MNPLRCPQCGKPLPEKVGPGPSHKYCTPECRTLFNNARHSTRKDPTKPIVRRGRRRPYEKRETCLQCGTSLVGTQRRRFCGERCAETYWNESRGKGLAATQHRLSNIDEDTQTADCAICGPRVPILGAGTVRRAGGGRRWKCRATDHTPHRLAVKKVGDWRKRGIDMDIERFETMLAAQGNRCAICQAEFTAAGAGAPVPDHDHATEVVRELLCGPCNMGIGQLGEDSRRLRAAADYLDRHRC